MIYPEKRTANIGSANLWSLHEASTNGIVSVATKDGPSGAKGVIGFAYLGASATELPKTASSGAGDMSYRGRPLRGDTLDVYLFGRSREATM